MESTLAVQEFIQQQIRKDPSNIDIILTPPDSQEEGVWKYEHLRYETLVNIVPGNNVMELRSFSIGNSVWN